MTRFFKIAGLVVLSLIGIAGTAFVAILGKAAWELEPPMKNYNYYG